MEVQSPKADPLRTENVILQVELDNTTKDLDGLRKQENYSRSCYTASNLDAKVIRMETGLPNTEVFNIVVEYVERFR